ncbi:MAG: YeeE/YedE family protein [Acetobacteraceae bacterium]|nr:YeeE/YedE family protein [Acetobacteraceae bacterium]
MNSLAPYWPSLAGGALIGLSATLLLLLLGRVAGISGIAGNLLRRPDEDWGWRAAFVLGLIGGPLLFLLLFGHPPALEIASSLPMLVIAGLLVGFGTRLGAGCTSGHGVCGLARLSPRSMAAVAVFMFTAIVTVFIRNHLV